MDVYLLNHLPLLKSTQERFKIFKDVTQRLIRDGCTMVSLPCGRMRDLLGLEYGNFRDVKIIGIDKDPEALLGSQTFSEQFNLNNVNINWSQGDVLREGIVYEGNIENEAHIVNSNGLNTYLNDDEVDIFYQQLYKIIKPGGTLVISQTTPYNCWKENDSFDMNLQKLIFTVIKPLWESYSRTVEKTIDQLQRAGFTVVDVIHDSKSMFPTFVVNKVN